MTRRPRSIVVVCAFCGDKMRSDGWGVYRKSEGWTKHRGQGGANQLTLKKDLDIFACERCISRLKRGINPVQEEIIPGQQTLV